jgi:hypothetical protein
MRRFRNALTGRLGVLGDRTARRLDAVVHLASLRHPARQRAQAREFAPRHPIRGAVSEYARTPRRDAA